MNTPRIPSWGKAIGAIAMGLLLFLTLTVDAEGPVRPSERRAEISGELKDLLLIMKEEEDVSLSRSLPIRQIKFDSMVNRY